MNIQQFTLEPVEVPANLVKDILHSILHSILFTRAFGLVRAAEGIIDLLEFYYVRCEDQSIDSYLTNKIDEFYDSWQKKKFEPQKRFILLSFDEKRTRSQLFGFSKVEERVKWEQWVIPIQIGKALSSNDPTDRKDKLEKDLRKLMYSITKQVNENKNHIPPLTNKDLTPFPYDITFPTQESNAGLFATLGSMLKSPTSPLLN